MKKQSKWEYTETCMQDDLKVLFFNEWLRINTKLLKFETPKEMRPTTRQMIPMQTVSQGPRWYDDAVDNQAISITFMNCGGAEASYWNVLSVRYTVAASYIAVLMVVVVTSQKYELYQSERRAIVHTCVARTHREYKDNRSSRTAIAIVTYKKQ